MDTIDLTNRKFGKLVAIKCIGKGKNRAYFWQCKCDCGNETFVRSANLVHSKTKSCGCLKHRIMEKNPRYKKDDVTRNTGGYRARKIFSLGKCEGCGEPATDRHHKDNNTLNNHPSNVQILCRTCHMMTDGRLIKLIQNFKPFIGEDSPNSKLKEQQVLAVRSLCNNGIIARDIASKFNICLSTVYAIKNRKIWKHL